MPLTDLFLRIFVQSRSNLRFHLPRTASCWGPDPHAHPPCYSDLLEGCIEKPGIRQLLLLLGSVINSIFVGVSERF
jgi:hypothetical protein